MTNNPETGQIIVTHDRFGKSQALILTDVEPDCCSLLNSVILSQKILLWDKSSLTTTHKNVFKVLCSKKRSVQAI